MTMENLDWDSADGLELIDFNGFYLFSFHGNTQREQGWATEGRCFLYSWSKRKLIIDVLVRIAKHYLYH